MNAALTLLVLRGQALERYSPEILGRAQVRNQYTESSC
jgi:hypothetical protein